MIKEEGEEKNNNGRRTKKKKCVVLLYWVIWSQAVREEIDMFEKLRKKIS